MVEEIRCRLLASFWFRSPSKECFLELFVSIGVGMYGGNEVLLCEAMMMVLDVCFNGKVQRLIEPNATTFQYAM